MVWFLFWVWVNSEKSRERQLLSVNLWICHNQTLIGLYLLENVLHWSKFKARSHYIFFSWTFDLLLINSNKYLLLEVYFSLHQRNTVYKYKLQRKLIIKEIQIDLHFHLHLIFILKNPIFFHVELKFLVNNF